jgi:uncharacterized protein
MKAYLDLENNTVHKSPYRYVSFGKNVFNGLPINEQLYFFKHGSDILVYAPYDRFVALINKKEYNYLLTHSISDKKIPKDLLYGKFYGVDRKSINFFKGPIFDPTELTVFLGDACNLHCVYCNATRARDDKKFNVEDTLTAIETIIKKYPIKHVSFFGNGEPLLYFDAIKKIVEFAEAQGIKSFYVATNAVFGSNTEKYVKFLVEHNIYTQISIDGYKEIHDLQRPMLNGKGSFEYVMRTINEFKKHGDINKYCLARFTLSEYASKHLKEIILFLYKIGFRKIRFAELIPEGRALQQTSEMTRPPNPLKMVDSVVEVLLLADRLGINLTGDYDPRTPSEAGIFPCPYMGGKAISLNKHLKILSCLEDYNEWIIGEVNPGKKDVVINIERLSNLQKRNMFNFEECKSCPVKCGGGCTHYSYLTYKALNIPGDYKEKCKALKLILKKYLIAKLIGREHGKILRKLKR